MTKKKIELEVIKARVKNDLKKIETLGWKRLSCDKWGLDHAFKLGADSLYRRGGEILCKKCILKNY